MDDKITVTCPECNTTGKAPASLAGKRVRCRKCQAVVEIPAAAAAADAVAPAAPAAPPPPPQAAPPPPQAAPPPPQAAPPAPPKAPPPPPAAAPPPPEAALPAQPVEQVVLATNDIAGTPCPACQKQVFVGDEVVVCAACGAVNHVHCWRAHEGCRSVTCCPPPAGEVAAATPAAQAAAVANMDCPACAEQIPADSVVCPYCGEQLGALAAPGIGGVGHAGVSGLPSTFKTLTGKKFVFTLTNDAVIGENIKTGEEISVLRANAVSELELTASRLVITTGGQRRKFNIEDIGHVAVNYWLTGEIVKRPSAVAKDALITAIVGIFCCQIILGPYAVYRAGQAQKDLDAYPQYIDGQGMVTAARIIGIIDIILAGLGVLANLAQIGAQ